MAAGHGHVLDVNVVRIERHPGPSTDRPIPAPMTVAHPLAEAPPAADLSVRVDGRDTPISLKHVVDTTNAATLFAKIEKNAGRIARVGARRGGHGSPRRLFAPRRRPPRRV